MTLPAGRTATAPLLRLTAPLEQVRGIGQARARQLGELGLRQIGQLLFHLPHRYEDRRAVRQVAELSEAGQVTLRGRLRDVKGVRLGRHGLSLVRGVFEDTSGALPVVWFNRPYLAGWVRPELEYLLCGELKRKGREGTKSQAWELVNPSCEDAQVAIHGARVVPVYPQLGELGPTQLRRLFAQLVPQVDWRELEEPLPAELLADHALPALPEALRALHAPDAEADVEALNACRSPAHQRLIYGELLELQLALARARERALAQRKRHAYRVDDGVRQAAREALPFKLTGAQRRAVREIVDDLRLPQPMLRLLQGDVGSGKTVVAAMAMVVAVESGLQAAFMAPTELLAEQHFRTLSRMLGERYRLGLFTGSAASTAEIRAGLERGEVQIAVGTHALIESRVGFARLGLAIIDEQHRFGVVQRQRLEAKGDRPDLLVMTATPIPRSLALTAYGDLALSVLDELPPGRLPIATELATAGERRQLYRSLKADLATGARAYVVFPLIEESDLVEAAAVESLGRKIQQYLGDVPSAVLHGNVPPAEREAILQRFAAGEIQVLLATTVIEVGLDVPEATWMVIESAERFGLAQLHQLRGRVGRGSRAARCVAVHGKLSTQAQERLRVFAETQDGFRIAEADLEIRGPGDLLGTRQAGLPRLIVADLVRDQEWLVRARADATRLLPRLGEPRLHALAERLRQGRESAGPLLGA